MASPSSVCISSRKWPPQLSLRSKASLHIKSPNSIKSATRPAFSSSGLNSSDVPGTVDEFNPELEKAGRVADFIELGELMCKDALERNESCGGHFREEMQTEEGEAMRNDENYSYVAAWEYMENGWNLHKEELKFENIKIAQRSYK